MSYYVSFPKLKEKEALIQIVPLGPLNHIVPNLTLLTIDLVWVKFLFAFLLHNNINLEDSKQVSEAIMNPKKGAYNRVLTWSYEYAMTNSDPPAGILIATRWNYGGKAREKGRDFFDLKKFGRYVKDILDSDDPSTFLAEAKKFSKGDLSAVSKKFLLQEEKLRNNVIGINLSDFPTTLFLQRVFEQLKPEHFTTHREDFLSLFIITFLEQFKETTELQNSDVINDHPIFHYTAFIKKELGITIKKDLVDKSNKSTADLEKIFPDPKQIKPYLSEQGFDAFLILALIRRNAPTHFHSFLILTFLKRRQISFRSNYLALGQTIFSEEFYLHLKSLEKSLSKFGNDFAQLTVDPKLLKFLAVWWEYYQFTLIGETITKNIKRYLLEDFTKNQIKSKIPSEQLNIIKEFLKDYSSSSINYIQALETDENSTEILSQLEEMEPLRSIDRIFEYLFDEAIKSTSKDFPGNPFFPSFDSFERWVDELSEVLALLD